MSWWCLSPLSSRRPAGRVGGRFAAGAVSAFTVALRVKNLPLTPAIVSVCPMSVPATGTVSYRFYLTVPVAGTLIGQTDTIAGVSGRFFTLSATVKAETAHGREATADATGWPAGGQQ